MMRIMMLIMMIMILLMLFQLVSNPHQFDVMVMLNLYGNIVDNQAVELVGGS